MEISDPERRLLRLLQRDASLSLAALSEHSGMAQSTVWRKVQDFEARGLIRARVALLSPQPLGCNLTVLAAISLTNHSDKIVSGFVALARAHPEITECMSVSGNADYHLKIRTRDVESYEHFLTHVLLRSDYVREVHSSFALKEIKSTTELPI